MEDKEKIRNELFRLIRKENDQYWSLLHDLMIQIKKVYDCDYIPNINTELQSLDEIMSKFKKIYNPNIHIKKTDLAFKRYIILADEHPNEYQINAVRQFSSLDIKSITEERYTKIIDDYPAYWDSAINDLIRPHAIRKRRLYLIDRIDVMVAECKKLDYSHLVEKLINYQNEQVAKLNE